VLEVYLSASVFGRVRIDLLDDKWRTTVGADEFAFFDNSECFFGTLQLYLEVPNLRSDNFEFVLFLLDFAATGFMISAELF
jgi:hypothetical protein